MRMFIKVLQSPISIILGTIFGVIIGLYFKQLAVVLEPLGQGYISLLIMAIMPMIVTAIIFNVAKLLHSNICKRKLLYFLVLLIFGAMIASVFSSIITWIFAPHLKLQQEIEFVLGVVLKSVEYYPHTGAIVNSITVSPFAEFLKTAIPSNIFLTLTEGVSLKLIIVSVLLGITLGILPEAKTNTLYNIVDQSNRFFKKILDGFLVILPFGLLCILAGVIKNLEWGELLSLLKLGILIYIICLLLLFFYLLLAAVFTKKSFWELLSKLKGTLGFSFIVSSGLLSISKSLDALEDVGVDPIIAETFLPLGIVINRHGKIVLLAVLATVFTLAYYQDISWYQFFMINFLSIILGLTASGRGATFIPIVLILVKNLSLPSEPVVAVLLVLSPFIMQIVSAVTVAANCALVMVFDNRFLANVKENNDA